MEAVKYICSSENFTEEKLIKTHKSDFMSVMWCVFNRYISDSVCRKHLEVAMIIEFLFHLFKPLKFL